MKLFLNIFYDFDYFYMRIHYFQCSEIKNKALQREIKSKTERPVQRNERETNIQHNKNWTSKILNSNQSFEIEVTIIK